jgi:hypothetical protein
MKKVIYIVALILTAGMAVKAQTTPTASAVDADAPVVIYESDVHDFGTIKQGDNGTCEFKFTNTGKTPVIISNAKGSCGCTVPDWPKEPIKPGQSSSIKATYDTKRIGAFTKTVTVSSNAKEATKVLTIKGVVEGENPNANMPFKKMDEGVPMEK